MTASRLPRPGGSRWTTRPRTIRSVLLLTALLGTARADDTAPPRVVLMGEPQNPLLTRLAAEVRSLGFEPLFHPALAAADLPAGMAEAARSLDAVAAIDLRPAEGSVEIWLVDRVTGKTVLREIPAEPETEASADLLVLRTVELLRASLLEVRLATPPPGGLPPPAAVENLIDLPPVAEEPAPLSFELSPAVVAGTFDYAPTLAVQIGAHLRIWNLLGVALFAQIPAVPLRLEAEAGEADLYMALLAAGLRLTFADPADTWLPFLEVGGAAGFADVRAQPAPGYAAEPALAVSGAPYLRGGVAVAVAPMLRLRLDVLLAWTMPATVVRFAEEEIATWGPLLLDCTLGLEVLGW